MTSDAMPVMTAKRLNCSSTASPINACATRNASACGTLTCPAGIGRDRVRSTLASRSRSVMSFQVQPAPRMAKAPTKNSAMTRGNRPMLLAMAAASAADHQHGISNSQNPIGRSRRASRKEGRDHGGANVSTQLPVASATRAAASFIWTLRPVSEPRSDRRRRSSLEGVAAQRIEGTAFLGGGSLRKRRCRTQHIAQARSCGSLLLHLLRHPTDLLLHGLGVLVALLQLIRDLRWNPAFLGMTLDVFDHLEFGLAEISDQLASLVRTGMPIAGRLDQLAALLRLFAQRKKPLHAIVGPGLRRGRCHRRVRERRRTGRWKRTGRRRRSKGRRRRCAVDRRKWGGVRRTGLARQRRRECTLRKALASMERNDGHGEWHDQAADHQSVPSGKVRWTL